METVKQLRAIAKQIGLRGYLKVSKRELIDMIEVKQNDINNEIKTCKTYREYLQDLMDNCSRKEILQNEDQCLHRNVETDGCFVICIDCATIIRRNL